MLTLTRILCIAIAATILLPQMLLAQSRKGISIRDVGSFSSPGNSGASTTFVGNSYGLGTAGRYGAGYASDVLRTSIGNPSSYDLTRRSLDANQVSGFSNLMAPPSGTYMRPGTAFDLKAGDSEPGALTTLLRSINKNSAGAYVAAIQNNPASRPDMDQPISTLVPSDPSMYRLFMERGDTAFRAGEFHRAFGEFQLANDIGGRDWMSLVSMMQARFAESDFSYYAAAHYARQAIKNFPELPLVPLRPKEFYGDKGKYGDGMVRLENRVDLYPYDADAPFVLAYFRWFETNSLEAAKALGKAYAASKATKQPEKVEACEAFWRGMVQSGRVTGVLTPTTLPAREELIPSSQSTTGPSLWDAAGNPAQEESGARR